MGNDLFDILIHFLLNGPRF